MSDAAITVLVAGIVQVVVLVVGFLSLREKLKYGEKIAKDVEVKLDANTATTEDVNTKADVIVSQTNGQMSEMQAIIRKIAERVDKLEDYNHQASHRMIDALNALHLKVAEVFAMQVSARGGLPDPQKPASPS